MAPLTGIASVLLFVAALTAEGQPPDADAATSDVVRFYAENDGRLLAAALTGGLAAAFLIWFGGSMFAALRRAEGEPGRVGVVAFGGFLLAAAGQALSFGFVFAAAEAVGDVPDEITQTLAVLAALCFVPFAAGALVALLASAVGILRHGALPRWLGYVTILIAIVFVVSAGFGAAIAIGAWILATAVWVVIASVVVFVHETRTERASATEQT